MNLSVLPFSLKHTPVSYDIWVSGTGLLATLSPQVELAHHPIQLHLQYTHRYTHKMKKSFKKSNQIAVVSCTSLSGHMFPHNSV